ncbi:Formylmethanofuran dehydrogenase subunit C [Methylophaga frappieri]|uniref:Formylmethanofuran dehydrogenase subunit C n=1 Tax=Methylophaga frappieri (strain ATCC BAA-2434 / DSM 25690 / JAM7) TaxID=754477 RepID=I1YJK9_METFJ|nr:formylmethanofuran dehydrogenase subunit C [Methylophaga frappieri]AFJ03102.1 Formylmethanofuran dehydrogenase subunit C [Methylophaga frappieri]
MSALKLTLKVSLAQRVDCSPLTPDKLAGKTRQEIAELPLFSGRRQLRVADLFDVDGDETDTIQIENSSDKLDHVGHAMASGEIQVSGNVGAYLGQFMSGGHIMVKGNSDLYTGCEMKGGQIKIEGNTGDFVGAARSGYKNGMTGGTIIITGNSGDRTGDHMRRGYILIEGNAGDYCGSRMVSGTIAVIGQTGAHLGYGMKRGTLLLNQAPKQGIGANFNDCGAHTLAFLPLMFASFKKLDSAFANLSPFSRVHRYAGDIGGIGMGEILVKIS